MAIASYKDYDYVMTPSGDAKYDEVDYSYEVYDDEADFLRNLTHETIYAHLRECIGKMTPSGIHKLIPPIIYGGFEISVQINYQLWNMRDDDDCDDNSPITEQEFDKIVDKTCRNLLDVRVTYDKQPFINATQMSIKQLALELRLSLVD